jgi:hypothetical protein
MLTFLVFISQGPVGEVAVPPEATPDRGDVTVNVVEFAAITVALATFKFAEAPETFVVPVTFTFWPTTGWR